MLNVGGPELLIIFLVALVVLGPTRLPQVARQVGQTVSSLRSLASGFQAEMEAASKSVSYDGPMHLPTEQAEGGELTDKERAQGVEDVADAPAATEKSNATRPSDIAKAARDVDVEAEATASDAAAEGKVINAIAAANARPGPVTPAPDDAAADAANGAPEAVADEDAETA